jgi:hypothetical protein
MNHKVAKANPHAVLVRRKITLFLPRSALFLMDGFSFFPLNDFSFLSGFQPEFPFCFPGDGSIPPVAAAAILFCIPSGAKEPDAPGRAFAGSKRP